MNDKQGGGRSVSRPRFRIPMLIPEMIVIEFKTATENQNSGIINPPRTTRDIIKRFRIPMLIPESIVTEFKTATENQNSGIYQSTNKKHVKLLEYHTFYFLCFNAIMPWLFLS